MRMIDRVFPLLKTPMVVRTSKDGRFLVFSDNVIRDTKTDLEWMVGPDEDTTYYQAEEWVQGLPQNYWWRLPTIDELQGLYEEGKGKCNIDPVFNETLECLWVWSGDTYFDKFCAYYFDFNFGNSTWGSCRYSTHGKVFAVRSGR